MLSTFCSHLLPAPANAACPKDGDTGNSPGASGAPAPSSSSVLDAQSTSLGALPLFAVALAALAPSWLGAAGGGAAEGADGPSCRVWGPGAPRWQVGGDPLSPLVWGRARLPLTWSVPS